MILMITCYCSMHNMSGHADQWGQVQFLEKQQETTLFLGKQNVLNIHVFSSQVDKLFFLHLSRKTKLFSRLEWIWRIDAETEGFNLR